MRNDIHTAIETWRLKNGLDLDSKERMELEREMLIIMSTPTLDERDDATIMARVNGIKKQIAEGRDPYTMLMMELDEQRGVPYAFAKVIQNLAAAIHSKAFAQGREQALDEEDAHFEDDEDDTPAADVLHPG